MTLVWRTCFFGSPMLDAFTQFHKHHLVYIVRRCSFVAGCTRSVPGWTAVSKISMVRQARLEPSMHAVPCCARPQRAEQCDEVGAGSAEDWGRHPRHEK